MSVQADESMYVARLDESQNEAFDYEYQSEVELLHKIAYLRQQFPEGVKHFLDLGGGNGKFMDRLLEEFPGSKGHIVDVSQHLLDLNAPNPNKTLINCAFEELDTLDLGFKFDVITINFVLHHLVGETYAESLRNVERALAIASRKLAPNGVIYVAENEYQGLLETNIPSHVIFFITKIQNPLFVKFARRYFNTAGVGVCFQSQKSWTKIFTAAKFRIDDYFMYSRWKHGLKKHIMFLALFLRTQRHGHFALRHAGQASTKV